jgi:hypothetical protein
MGMRLAMLEGHPAAPTVRRRLTSTEKKPDSFTLPESSARNLMASSVSTYRPHTVMDQFKRKRRLRGASHAPRTYPHGEHELALLSVVLLRNLCQIHRSEVRPLEEGVQGVLPAEGGVLEGRRASCEKWAPVVWL